MRLGNSDGEAWVQWGLEPPLTCFSEKAEEEECPGYVREVVGSMAVSDGETCLVWTL